MLGLSLAASLGAATGNTHGDQNRGVSQGLRTVRYLRVQDHQSSRSELRSVVTHSDRDIPAQALNRHRPVDVVLSLDRASLERDARNRPSFTRVLAARLELAVEARSRRASSSAFNRNSNLVPESLWERAYAVFGRTAGLFAAFFPGPPVLALVVPAIADLLRPTRSAARGMHCFLLVMLSDPSTNRPSTTMERLSSTK